MPHPDYDPRGSPPQNGPREADEERARLRPQMGRRARDRLACGSPGIARLVLRGHGKRARPRAHVNQLPAGVGPGRYARRVTIQAHVHRMTRGGASAAAEHLAYIERDGAEKDGSPAVLYGPDGRVPRERFEEPRLHEQHQFRFMVSPEDGHELELDDYVRRLMRRVERELGRSLEWAAANHYDTEHPHAHVVVRGIDLHGRRVLLSRQYISHGMRWSAQELATELLGPRLESEIQRTREREVTQERFTSLDRELARCATDHQVGADSVRRQSRDDQEAQHLVDRLEHLERMGVATRISPSTWELTQGWQAHLRELGERGDIIKQIHRAMRGGDPARFHAVRPGQDAARAAPARLRELERLGLVAAQGPGQWSVPPDLLEQLEQRRRDAPRYRLSVQPAPLSLDAQVRHPGLVLLDTVDSQALAGRGFGADVQRALERRRDVLREFGIAPDDPLRDAKVHDLERRTVGREIAKRIGETFLETVPDGFRGRVQALPENHPYLAVTDGRRFVLVAATPEWRSRAGQSIEVRRDAQGRIMLGEDPARAADRQKRARRAAGETLARETGRNFLPTVPNGFRGWVQPGPEGSPYLAVTDGARFILVPATPEARALSGKTVDVSRDAHGRFVGLQRRDRDHDRGR